MIKHILLITVILFLSVRLLCAQDVSIEASVDKDTVHLDETFTLTVVLRGGAELSMTANIDMPELDDFEIINQSRNTVFSIIPGQAESTQTLQYILQPVKSGKFVIDSIAFHSGGKTVKSNPIQVTVENTVSPTVSVPTYVPPRSYQLPDKYSYYDDKDMWTEQHVDIENPYVNQQVTLTFKFYYRVNISGEAQYQPPDTTGFKVVELHKSSISSTETINGIDFNVDCVKLALFPVSAGDKTVGQTLLNVPVDFFDYKTLKSNKSNVHVRSLPAEGRPSSFSGAVGEFIIYGKLDREEVEINQPVSLELTVEGFGNVDSIGQPVLTGINGFKVYPSGSAADSTVKDNLVYGQKKFKYVLMPSRAGIIDIPEIKYTYFNPGDGTYENIKTKPFKIKVLEGKGSFSSPDQAGAQQEIKITGQDISHIKTDVSLNNENPFLYKNLALRIFIFIPPIGLLISFFYKKHLNRLNSDLGFARFTRAYKKARLNLSKAGNETPDNLQFYSLISRVITDYIADKLNLPSAGLTRDHICSILEEKKMDSDIIEEFKRLYEKCEYARFAPASSSEQDRTTVLSLTEKILNDIAKII
ncbi:MAG: BatD family protein [Candidatus Eremiobacterota bacterium]